MYNDKMKKDFLNTLANENSYKAYIRIFQGIEDLESTFNKDICEMNTDEILTVLDLKTGAKAGNLIQTMSLLKSYVDWCLQNGKIVGENNFEKIDFSEVNQSRSLLAQYLKDEEEFEKMCSEVYKITSDYNDGVEKPNELLVRLMFLELEPEEIMNLKKTDVDYENMIIHSPLYPIDYHVSQKELLLCRFCAEQESVDYAESERSKDKKERICDNEYLIRSRVSALRKGRSENATISTVRIMRTAREFYEKYYEESNIYKKLTQSKLAESHRLIRIHKSGTPMEYIDTIIRNEILVKEPNIKNTTMYSRLFNLKKLYETWEKAFYQN